MTLDKYILKAFLPVFGATTFMFVVLVCLIDLFANLVSFLSNEAVFSQILLVTAFYVPKALSFALPMSLLFSVAYSLGALYAKNELTSIIASGIPFWRLTASLMIIGAAASFFSFFWDDVMVVPSLKQKNELSRKLKHQAAAASMSDIVIKTEGGKRVYAIDYYDQDKLTLNGVNIIERDDGGNLVKRIISPQASWNIDHWVFSNPFLYQKEADRIEIGMMPATTDYREQPDTFRRHAVDAAELPVREAGLLVKDLQDAGLPFIEAQAEYYHRFSFSSVSFIVIILSISMGGRFRKNILLMSLLTSLIIAVVFYVMEMITMMLGRMGYIPPIVGAWFPVGFFILVGVFMVRYSKT
jgi:lipopolysaccharide export system permease protein